MPTERTSDGFGGRLRDARERKGISLRQIANTTKISVSALEALERNDISRLPGGIFSRAFVRSYAIEVGLDPEETIQQFLAQFPSDSVTAGHPASAHVEDGESLESDRRMATTLLRLLAVSVPIAAVVVYFGTAGARRPDAPPPPMAQADEMRAPPPAPGIEAPEVLVSAPPPAQAFADRLTVGLSATGLCWVAVIVDGQRVLERQLQAGERHAFDVRHELVLTAGDAAVLQLTLNGEAAKPLGRPGQVVTTRVNPANFKTLLAAP